MRSASERITVPAMATHGYGRQSFMASLLESDRQSLAEAARQREWRHGDVLVHAGDRSDSAIVLLSGLVKIHRVAAGGEDVVLGIAGAGDLLGEMSAVRDSVRSASASALTDVRGLVLGVPDLRGFLSDRPQATLALLDSALTRLYAADARRLEFATAESLARVTSRLIELAERFGEPRTTGEIEVALPFNQEELASWSAASRESTARALRTLRELGLIETHRLRLIVLDLEGLRTHAPRL